jgi:hypothetical protein
MEMQNHNNRYAQLLKEQGNYVIAVKGVDWYDYGGFMVPAYLPHCVPVVTRESALEVLRKSGRPFARWSTKFGLPENSEWWFVLRKGTWSLEQCSANTRSKIRRGYKRLAARLISPDEMLNIGYGVLEKAMDRYEHKEFLPSRQTFEKKIKASAALTGTLDLFGVFSGTQLVGYSENYIQDNAAFWESIWYDPEFLKDYSSYVLVAEMLKYYLNERHFKYVLDGCRSIYHRSEIQEYLMHSFGFTKEYAHLNVVYRPWFTMGVKAAYVFKGAIWSLNSRWINSTLDKVSGILRQEQIRRACERQAYPSVKVK